jgi:DNA integrity scanning protein DisA with diadenylate cyclase activity
MMDTLVVMSFASEYELLDAGDETAVARRVDLAVFHRVLTIALRIGQFGREGRRVGALFVVGDHENVLERSDQAILNPFHGYTESDRNVLDDRMIETVREYASIDGAIIIRDDGTIESAGTQLRIGRTEDLPAGLGARHGAAAGITAGTAAIAITVSETDGTVRVWRAGRLAAGFEPATR